MQIKKIKIEKKKLWWLGIFIFLVIFHSNHPLNSDEGVILDGAWSLFNGCELYTEAVHYIPPGNFYFVFILWKIFGVHYLIAKFAYVILTFAAGIGIYKISRKIYDHDFALLTPLPFFISSFAWPLINHNTANIFFIIWSTYFFLQGLETRDKKDFIWSGVVTGLGILFLQHKSGVLLAALLGFLLILYIKEREEKTIKNGFYYLIFSLLPLIIMLKWPLETLYYYFYFFIAHTYREYNQVPPWLFILFFSLFIISILVFKKQINKKIALLLYIEAVLLGLAYVQMPDFYHASLILFPLYALAPLAFLELKKQNAFLRNCYHAALGTTSLIIILAAAVYITEFPPFCAPDKNFIKIIKNACQESPYIYAGPFLPNYYFETNKINPTPFYTLVINAQDMQIEDKTNVVLRQYRRTEEIFKKTPPICAVVNYKIMEKFNYEINNPVDNFILNNYELIDTLSNTMLYKLKKK